MSPEGMLPTELFGLTCFRQLSQFVASIAFFNGSEYFLAASIHGTSTVDSSSLLFSKQYCVAMTFAILEYVIEFFMVPEVKERWLMSNIGLGMVIVGEVIRKIGILTARRAFTHNIRIYHEDHHELITHGIYRIIRHPGYCGFFIWAIGTQLMLCNPICTVGFTVVTWRFFYKRIPYEEFFLREFFGSQHVEYTSEVPSGLPFIK